jgi:hypothetical protein
MTLFKDISTTVNGKMMFRMEKERKNSKMGHITKGISFMASNQESVTMSVILGYTKENSQTAISMEMGFSPMLITGSIMGNGRMDLSKVLESLHGQMATGMRENTLVDLNMERVPFSLQMERSLREDGEMDRNMGKGSLSWGIKLSRDCGRMESSRMLLKSDTYIFFISAKINKIVKSFQIITEPLKGISVSASLCDAAHEQFLRSQSAFSPRLVRIYS